MSLFLESMIFPSAISLYFTDPDMLIHECESINNNDNNNNNNNSEKKKKKINNNNNNK